MTDETKNLIKLFTEFIQNPQVMFALRAQMMGNNLRGGRRRTGAPALLVQLWQQDGLTNSELAEILDIKPSSVTAQVKSLEEHGLVIRRADDSDKRISRIFLTDKGMDLKNKQSTAHNELSEDIFGTLSAAEQEDLARLLTKLIKKNHDSTDFFNHRDFPPTGFGNHRNWKSFWQHDSSFTDDADDHWYHR